MNNERRKQIKSIQADIDEMMAAREAAIEAFTAKASEIKDSIESIRDDEQEYLDAMPESMQNGEKGDGVNTAISLLDDAAGDLDEPEFDSFDPDDVKGKLDEAMGG